MVLVPLANSQCEQVYYRGREGWTTSGRVNGLWKGSYSLLGDDSLQRNSLSKRHMMPFRACLYV